MTIEEYINQLDDLLEEKYESLIEILSLTRLQSDALEKEDVAALEKLVEEKQVKINKINLLDEKFSRIFEQVKRQFAIDRIDELDESKELNITGAKNLNITGVKSLNITGVKSLKGKTSKILDIINNEISVLEKKNNESILELMNRYKMEFKNIVSGKKALSAYNNNFSTHTPSFYIDKKK
ncbi:MAG TPA: flagellar export chaperone FlgN [Clostridiales bacterium]|nr:flagellar export chaperone FlgN [Clostridiales bacterium]